MLGCQLKLWMSLYETQELIKQITHTFNYQYFQPPDFSPRQHFDQQQEKSSLLHYYAQ